jgi:hypothetical protein
MVEVQTPTDESFRFRLSSLFWITTAMAMVMAYGRSLGLNELRMAFAYASFVVCMTGIIGLVCRLWNDTAFWSIVVTLIAFIAVAGHPMPNQSIAFGWGLVAAGCGALCGARYPKQVWLGVLMSGILGIVLMCLSIFFAQASVTDLLALFDIASAGVVGGLTRLFIELISSLIRRAQVPRLVFAAWIISCVVIGRATVPWAVAWLVPKFFGD